MSEQHRVIVAIPTRGRPHLAVQAAVQRIAVLANAQLWMTQGEPVTVARNKIALAFMKTDATHLLMVDDDTMPLRGDTIARLLNVGTPIATGVTPMIFDEKLVVNVARGNDWEPAWPEGQFEVRVCGASCLMIAREVFEKIEWPWFQFHQTRDDGFRGEDTNFCAKAADCGLLIGCDGSVICEHFKEVGLTRFLPPIPPAPVLAGQPCEVTHG